MKKAQGLPLNTIILAILALIVLVALILIFTGKINVFGKGASECVTGTDGCVKDPINDCAEGTVGYPSEGCNQDSPYCCPKGKR